MRSHSPSVNFKTRLSEHISIFNELSNVTPSYSKAVDLIASVIPNNKIFICGNGGSASDSQHFAAELICRFESERLPCPWIELSSGNSTLTAIANDFNYEDIFKRQLLALGQPGDLLICLSTSGESVNVLEASKSAKTLGIKTLTFTGANTQSSLALLSDLSICVPSQSTAFIQEAHIFLLHCLASEIDLFFNGK